MDTCMLVNALLLLKGSRQFRRNREAIRTIITLINNSFPN